MKVSGREMQKNILLVVPDDALIFMNENKYTSSTDIYNPVSIHARLEFQLHFL